MVLSVLAAGITGIFWLVPILFVLPDVQTLLSVATGTTNAFTIQDGDGQCWRWIWFIVFDSWRFVLCWSGKFDCCKSMYVRICPRWSDSILKIVHLLVFDLTRDGQR